MSAADEDTELRDLLIHTLESNGVLSKIKAELRASVFLALEEQERADSKPSLVNEKLRHFLSSREGRLAAGLVTDFLQYFHLDFTLAVLQPEASLQLDDRAPLARELGLPAKSGPLLQELIAGRESAPNHIALAQAGFDRYDRNKTGEISKDEARELFEDLFPGFPRSMLGVFIGEEHPAGGSIKLQHVMAMYRRLVALCRAGGALGSQEIRTDNSSEQSRSGPQANPPLLPCTKLPDPNQDREEARLDEEEEEGDSFFDDPIPRPEKAYGWREDASKPNGSLDPFLQRSQTSIHDEDSQRSSLRDLKSTSEKMASMELGQAAPEDDYADDFHSTSQRSDKSEVSIGEDLEEELSVDDLTASDHKLEDFTLDNSISHISDVADYLEDVS